MKRSMTKSEGRAFKRRWRLVNEFEKKELRRTSLETKLRQLAALMASAKEMGWDEVLARAQGEREVWERWQRLRKAYGV
ncbi:MAG TPA: hypothetical protein VGG61_00670 [Gemmataceae bacterium]|jgi:hypothetical protein